jgi:hypothetical protein
MNSKMKTSVRVSMVHLSLSIALLAAALCGAMAAAQTAARFLGTITAISGTTLTVKTDAGEVHQLDVPATATLKRIAPGEKDLSKAETIQFSDLETGDRVLVKLDPNAAAGTTQAQQIIAVKAADVAQKQQKEREDWQRNSVGGMVKSVDSGAGVIVLTSGVGATAKTINVHTTKTTMLKRYAPASVRFDEAQAAPIDAIHAGDQVRARGEKNAGGMEITAVEVVSGSFRNISGTIASLDTAGSTLVVKDLATKKQMTIHITADAQMKRLPDRVAQMLAMRLKGGASGSGGAPAGGWNGNGQSAGGAGSAPRTGGAQGGGQGGGDPQQVLSRAPAIQLADLKKGDAVMLVSTDGATNVTAITLLAGVEPLLEAPAASQNLLNNWSMGSGAPDAGAQ